MTYDTVATVLTVYGIETIIKSFGCDGMIVATVLTVYGIETRLYNKLDPSLLTELQQYLPFTVLKHSEKV